MAGQLIPPPEMAPCLRPGTTSEQRIWMWIDLMNASGAFLLGGFHMRQGPDVDVLPAYRKWYGKWMDEHDETVCHMLKELARRERVSSGR